ncbi:unnamed protein product [Absidia cylindrospora]
MGPCFRFWGGEVAGESENLYGTCKDLLRLGIFSKNGIDVGKMKSILSFQVIGRSITFYLSILLNDGLYVMLELAHITAPGCMDDLLGYYMEFNKVLFVLDVFETWCYSLPSDKTEQQNQRSRPSLSSPTFCRVVSSTTCRSRQSVLKYYYN